MRIEDLCSSFNDRMEARMRADLPLFTPPVVISAQVGSRGPAVAKEIATRLDIPLLDGDFLNQLTSQGQLHITATQPGDESNTETVSSIELKPLTPDDSSLDKDFSALLRHNVSVLLKAGNVILIDRAANCVAEPGQALHIRITAPFEARLGNWVDERKLSRERARSELIRLEKEQLEFITYTYGHDESDPASYDLVLNTGQLSIDNCAEISLAAYQERFGALLTEPVPVERTPSGKPARNPSTRDGRVRSRPLDPMHPF